MSSLDGWMMREQEEGAPTALDHAEAEIARLRAELAGAREAGIREGCAAAAINTRQFGDIIGAGSPANARHALILAADQIEALSVEDCRSLLSEGGA